MEEPLAARLSALKMMLVTVHRGTGLSFKVNKVLN